MTVIDQAIVAIRRLPLQEQEALGRELLERIAADEKWDQLLADPRSRPVLSRLADETRQEIARGETRDQDPSDAANS
jgi:hypothetical protein